MTQTCIRSFSTSSNNASTSGLIGSSSSSTSPISSSSARTTLTSTHSGTHITLHTFKHLQMRFAIFLARTSSGNSHLPSSRRELTISSCRDRRRPYFASASSLGWSRRYTLDRRMDRSGVYLSSKSREFHYVRVLVESCVIWVHVHDHHLRLIVKLAVNKLDHEDSQLYRHRQNNP
jgi:hypothetical protein